MLTVRSDESVESPERVIAGILEGVRHLLPEQAPLHAFVHHNPLHAFEHLPFERAVVEAASIFGTEPFQSEQAFAHSLEIGRIRESDVESVVDDDLGPEPGPAICGLQRREFILGRLLHPFEVPIGATLLWQLVETPAQRAIHPLVHSARRRTLLHHAEARYGSLSQSTLETLLMTELWQRMKEVASPVEEQPHRPRPRDRIRDALGIDPDTWVHPLLIRLCAAFLDQGVAYWTMARREEGILRAFRRLYGLPVGPPDRWMNGLAGECRRQQREAWTAESTIVWALVALEVPPKDWPIVIRDTLLSLRGWAGMMSQFEQHPQRAPVVAHPARLADYLAVQMTLDVFASRHALCSATSEQGSLLELRPQTTPPPRDLELVYEAFVAAQLLPVEPAAFEDSAHARSWLTAIAEFDGLARRRLLHRAYERSYRVRVLDGMQAHERLDRRQLPSPEFQAVFCIDERSESLRRHLEEICTVAETFGYAGFFGVAMAYQGLDDIHPRPLCPVALSPRHQIVERAIEKEEESSYRNLRRRHGTLRHALGVGSKSLARGGILTAVTGLMSVVPLIGRCLFPALTERWSQRLDQGAVTGPATRLEIERSGPLTCEDGGDLLRGYTVLEMAGIVETALLTMGIAGACAPLVLIVGHGSSSLNNPHEAAHDCGATGGGRGGPNARAFAAMGNHPGVRHALAGRGINLPKNSWFVGAYHNTCDDSVRYYDDDLVPAAAREHFELAVRSMRAACALDAHERCRRFGTSPRDLDIGKAIAHVKAHSTDLAQPRPEYGHATNASCIVGRRSRTRGLFLDRRPFLVSYDPTTDPSGEGLATLLLSVGPVGAGINLEYYFSFVDPVGYGCGTKLPHNIVGLIGVMDGHASDLRTGLPWQMVEIHEPMRLLMIVEAAADTLERILEAHEGLDQLVRNEWIQLVSWSPDSPAMHVFANGAFIPYVPESTAIPILDRSPAFYSGHHEHLGLAHLTAAFGGAPA